MKITMSDEWFYGSRPRRSSSRWVPLLVAILIVANMGVVAYNTISTNDQMRGLRQQTDTLMLSVESLNKELTSKGVEITALREAVKNVGGGTGTTPQPDSLLIDLYNKTRESVVMIIVKLPTGAAEGSGFVYDASGRIITNNHVVEDATSITVTFIDGTIVDATLVGRDPYSDVAVISVNAPASLIKPLKLGKSSLLKVGQSVVAIGNPYGLANTLTSGIISAVGRQMDSTGNYPIVDVIQTDAAINPGNSGGPLLNMDGEVVGINTAIPSETSRGIGFAVPSDTIARELPSLISKGTYSHPYLGIQGRDVTQGIVGSMSLPTGTRGTLVIEVTSGGPAGIAGMRGGTRTETIDGVSTKLGGDVITSADGTQMKTFYDLIVYIQRNKVPGAKITLGIIRDSSPRNIVVTLGTRPPP
jgi:S1-C subfamily serine protease